MSENLVKPERVLVSYKERDIDNMPVFEGLSDGGHNYIKCSSCLAPLAEVWVTKPDIDDIFTILPIKCPHCGDKSFQFEVTGFFGVAGGTEKDIDYSSLVDVRYNGNNIQIVVEKVKEYV